MPGVIVKKVKLSTWIYIVHRREVPLMRYRFPQVSTDIRKSTLQPGISEHCETT